MGIAVGFLLSGCICWDCRKLVTGSVWIRESGGFRFELLRQIIMDQDAEDSGDDDSGDDTSARCVRVVLMNLVLVEATMRMVLSSDNGDDASMSTRYEALGFLRELVKHLQYSDGLKTPQVAALIQMVEGLMEEAIVSMDYALQPTFVSCAVLGFMTDFHELISMWKTKNHGVGATGTYSNWMDQCFTWLHQSSCTTEALRLLNEEESPSVASEAALISDRSRYPFLQQWLLCVSRLGVSLFKVISGGGDNVNALRLTTTSCLQFTEQFPSRQKLFTVISEQDDVMIEVLNALTQIAVFTDPGSGTLDQLPSWILPFARRVAAEYNPDLLFAYLVDILGRDHLVFLDLLSSNETRALEYFTRYLRRLGKTWVTSKAMLELVGQLDTVLSVLIRLRLEIDRLVAANLFPYNANPLVRRLLVIEQLYEQADNE